MTRKKQNKILDAKIGSNVNQYRVHRLNAEISVFSSGDLNKYEFLKRIDLNCKPNAIDKARFEFSALGKTFSSGLDKTAQGYQEEGIIKLLKDIRDGLAGGIIPRGPGGPGLDRSDDDDDDMPDLETEEEAKRGALNKFKDKIDNFDEIFKNKEDEFNKTFKDKENKLNKLKINFKKIKNYIEENNNKIFAIGNKVAHTENERDNLLLKSNQLYSTLRGTKNELYETKKRLDEAEDEINKKKYIDKIKEIQEKNDYQENEIKKT